jgi:hypothetical protein
MYFFNENDKETAKPENDKLIKIWTIEITNIIILNLLMIDLNKRKKNLQLAMSFWIGVGLMSIINVWKITQGNNAILYSWIMFCVSVLFLIICIIYLISINQKSKIQ